ncbi:MAG TPA: carboxypeptidase-like regulatory domain-containing protein [Candidatus Sulfotelmatobacter sp.]|nr:carboxypeptidase-like regulatory domain-containing protein [Candidatus Sulfotelmatobacter sp.]
MRLSAPFKTHAPAAICLFLALAPALLPAQSPDSPQAPSVQISKQPAPPQRIPREQALTTAALEGTVREQVSASALRPIAAAQLSLRNTQTNQTISAVSAGDGLFRIFPLVPGTYELHVRAAGYAELSVPALSLNANEVLTLEILLVPVANSALTSRLPRQPELGPPLPAQAVPATGSYREFRHRLDADPNYILELAPEVLPPAADVYNTVPDRWQLPQPSYRRYPANDESIYAKPHWYDPFNHNRFKGDQPIWPELFGQQVFLDVTATAETFLNPRYLPTPTDISPARPGTSNFFGDGNQFFLDQTFSVSFDLFHGDTSFKPVDWRIRVTPELSLNYLDVQELGIVNVNPQKGTTRFDDHVGLQEAFVEVKLHDLSPNYDFVSARAGIQQFNADFRGFLFVDQQPGLRIFGNWDSDRFEYNAAYFNLLEKNTNSELNSFALRQQQVVLANLYWQDFFFPGYTAEFVGAWNKDDPSIHFNDDGFLVRPAPIGNVVNQGVGFIPHGIRVGYFGWLGSGHIRRLNLTHAFYEAAGEDTFNPIAGRKVTVNAQMAAVELSYDKDWIRYRVSSFYASGDSDPRDGRANGFDSIVDLPNFAGGIFSFWNQQAIRLTGTGVNLTQEGSLLPDMRTDKFEGQANFVNPGIFLVNAGADFDITPKLKGFANYNFLRFMRTEPLEYVLFQAPIHHTIGSDLGLGVEYRPPLSENLVLSGGASMLQPGQGFRDIYTGHTQFSVFALAKLLF